MMQSVKAPRVSCATCLTGSQLREEKLVRACVPFEVVDLEIAALGPWHDAGAPKTVPQIFTKKKKFPTKRASEAEYRARSSQI